MKVDLGRILEYDGPYGSIGTEGMEHCFVVIVLGCAASRH